jgi:hypothetical protein
MTSVVTLDEGRRLRGFLGDDWNVSPRVLTEEPRWT